MNDLEKKVNKYTLLKMNLNKNTKLEIYYEHYSSTISAFGKGGKLNKSKVHTGLFGFKIYKHFYSMEANE